MTTRQNVQQESLSETFRVFTLTVKSEWVTAGVEHQFGLPGNMFRTGVNELFGSSRIRREMLRSAR